jgi:hypothetical protein
MRISSLPRFHVKPPSATRTGLVSLAIAASLSAHPVAHAGGSASQVSEASLVPVAISAAIPVVLIAGAGSVVVTGVQASAEGTVWLVENIADGVKGSICFAGTAAGMSAIAAGTVVVVTVVASGMLLSTAGRVIAFIPNETARSLSYNQRVSR